MNSTGFIKKVRITAVTNFISHFVPVTAVILCLILFLLHAIPFDTIFNPEKVSFTDTYENLKKGDYVTVTYDTLYYTGYDIRVGNSSKGSYYYSLTDGKCIFLIVDGKNFSSPPKELKEYTARFKVIGHDALYNTMLSTFYGDIGWTLSGISSISADYLLSEIDYHSLRYYILFLTMIAIIVISVYNLISNILYILLPTVFHPCFRKLRRIAGAKNNFTKYLDMISDEYSQPAEFTSGTTTITQHFFIDVSSKNITVLPLDRIIWIYSIQHFKKFLWLKNLYSYISLVTCEGVKSHINRKPAEDTREMFDYFIANYPDVLLKYSRHNKEAADRIIRENKRAESN